MSEDGRKLAELEAQASERNTENLESRLAALEAEKAREAAANQQGKRVAGVPGYDFRFGVEELAREKADAIERGDIETSASRIERFREQHSDIGRAAALLEREAQQEKPEQ